MSSFQWSPLQSGGSGVSSVNSLTGALTLAAGTGINIVSNSTDTLTFSVTSAGDVTIGTFGSTPNDSGASISGSQVLTLQPADGTHPGGVSTTTQTFAGQKTFSTGLTGTLTGAASLNVLTSALGNLTDAGTDGIVVTGGTGAVVGAVSLAQHVADATHNGYLSSADWVTFNAKQAAGNYITALTGDATASGPGSAALTLATVNSNIGSFAISTVTVNAKGLVTAASAASTTGSGSVVLATSPTLVTPALGTPSALVGTNITGTAAGLTAGTVTTNANLTGDVTSVGNATTVAKIQTTTVSGTTGSGNVVFSTSPTLVTPALGTPSALVGTNITGTASGLTAGTVTTNANLTGDVTSSGNATTVAKIQTTTVSGTTGSGNVVFSTSPTLTTPALGTPSALVGTNITGTAAGLTAGTVTTNANLTGDITSSGNATTAAATQANIATLSRAAGVAVHGTNTNDSASAGFVGEYISGRPGADVTPAASGSPKTVTSISLTAGDWDVQGLVFITVSASGILNYVASVSTTDNVHSFNSFTGYVTAPTSATVTANANQAVNTGTARISLSATTTIYLVATVNYTSLSTTLYLTNSFIYARRVR